MPEGDTIFRTAAALHAALAGRALTGVRVGAGPGAGPLAQLPRRLAGRTVTGVDARGKHLLVRFDDGMVLRTHQRMTGSWHLYPRGGRWRKPARAMRVALLTDAFEAVCFSSPVVDLLEPGAEALDPALAGLGPDPLNDWDAPRAASLLRAQGDRAVGEALLDQRVLAGVANIFRCETLFVCGVGPWRTVSSLDDPTVRRLVDTAAALLRANAGNRSARITTTALGAGPRASADRATWVYGREGRPCHRCRTEIRAALQGRGDAGPRRTSWCPRCQPAPA